MIPLLVQPISNEESTNILPVPWIRFHRCRFHGIDRLVDHIPHNIVALLTMRNFGFSGAIDVFVFVSGYAAAIQYGKMTLERGFVVAATRIIKRAWQLYAAHLG